MECHICCSKEMTSKDNCFQQVVVIGRLLIECRRKWEWHLLTQKTPVFSALTLVLGSLEHCIALLFWVALATEPTEKFESTLKASTIVKKHELLRPVNRSIIMLKLALNMFLLVWKYQWPYSCDCCPRKFRSVHKFLLLTIFHGTTEKQTNSAGFTTSTVYYSVTHKWELLIIGELLLKNK
jgi:hypothetical protein